MLSSPSSPLHPYEEVFLCMCDVNSSAVDLLEMDQQCRGLYSDDCHCNSSGEDSGGSSRPCRFPLLSQAPYTETVLGPGDMLHIPRHCWHFIVAISADTAEHWCSNQRTKAPEGPLSPDWYWKLKTTGTTACTNTRVAEHEYSFSLSFWWGKRILKPS